MDQLKWFFHPMSVFIFSVAAVCLSLALYIYWYVEISTGLTKVLKKANLGPEQVLTAQTWVVILVLSILVGIILMGLFFIFVFNHKTYQLYRMQRNFIDNFTHELKTPVTSLKLYLETFQKHEFPRDEQIKYISYMVQDVDRLSNNITRILDLAKIESNSYDEKFIIEDLVDLTEKFINKNRHLFSGSEIIIHNPGKRPFLYPVSLSLFEMLLMNIITNGIKYNESLVPRLDITFTQGVRKMTIDFKDNGIGIAKKEISKIFRKFYQIGQSKDMSAKGTGIGLHLAQSIAKLHKGRIFAESQETGKGSVFSVVLPIKGFSASKV
jgi:two-component system, OmpR family, phosphate regulon sensor histidine kinase PhoR